MSLLLLFAGADGAGIVPVGVIPLELGRRTLALSLEERPLTLSLRHRTLTHSLGYRDGGVYMPSLMTLEDESAGYWLFEDGSRVMWEAGDVSTPLKLSRRKLALSLGKRD